MTTLIVGFGFRARHGKDTVARHLVDILPAGQAQVLPLALHVKAVARALGMREKDGPLLQALGTDVFRRLDPGVWVRCLESWIAEERPVVAVVPDVRFENEARWVARCGGLLYRVDRTNGDGSPFVSPDRDPGHRSETELAGAAFDRYFTARSGDVAALHAAAVQVAYDVRDRLSRRTSLEPDGSSDPCGRPDCEQYRVDVGAGLAAARRALG